jgi:hypothetical protein
MAGTLDNKQTDDSLAANGAAPETANGAPPAAPEALPSAPETLPSAPDDASRLCTNCAALLAEGQDWCLECGTAQPGRIGDKPGWRPALTIVLLTAILAAGAVAAAYAALSSDAERQASAPPPPSAQPVVPPAPVQAAPAPAETTPEVAAPEDNADDTPAPAPKDDAPDPAPAPSPAPAPAPSGGGDDGAAEDEGTDGGSDTKTKPEPTTVALSPDAASTYDPFDRAGGLTGDPADAIDGRRGTAWEAPVGQDGLVNIGLLVSLEKAKAFERVRLQAGTPGFTVELYGSKRGTAPEGDPTQTAAWEKLDTTRDFGTDENLRVGKGKWRYVLLWFTDQPADTKVMIPEVALRLN